MTIANRGLNNGCYYYRAYAMEPLLSSKTRKSILRLLSFVEAKRCCYGDDGSRSLHIPFVLGYSDLRIITVNLPTLVAKAGYACARPNLDAFDWAVLQLASTTVCGSQARTPLPRLLSLASTAKVLTWLRLAPWRKSTEVPFASCSWPADRTLASAACL